MPELSDVDLDDLLDDLKKISEGSSRGQNWATPLKHTPVVGLQDDYFNTEKILPVPKYRSPRKGKENNRPNVVKSLPKMKIKQITTTPSRRQRRIPLADTDSESDNKSPSPWPSGSDMSDRELKRRLRSPQKVSEYSCRVQKLVEERRGTIHVERSMSPPAIVTPRKTRIIISSDEESDDGEPDVPQQNVDILPDSQEEDSIIDDDDDNMSDFIVDDDDSDNEIITISDEENVKPTATTTAKVAAKVLKTTQTPAGHREFKKSREVIASSFFADLNQRVFDNKIPSLPINWSQRLNKTAGRAFRKASKGERDPAKWTLYIELASKVIDDESKLRNTLAHEMCHVASWVISRELKNPHGRVFKSWAAKVMRRFPDVEVTTKHSYKIAYKFQWRCSNDACGHVYGRHSKSIDPACHRCGKCKGTLIPIDRNNNPTTPGKLSLYTEFVRANLKSIKTQHPELTHAQLMARVSQAWNDHKMNQTQRTTLTNAATDTTLSSLLSLLSL